MPQTTSAKKALRKASRKRVVNDVWRTKVRTALRDMRETLEAKNKDKATQALPQLFSVIDRAAQKNVVHTNRAARIKARLSAAVQKLSS